MKRLLLVIVVVILLIPIALVGAVFLAVSDEAAVNRRADITLENIERAKQFLDKNDPRKLPAGVRRTISMTENDADVVANYLAHRYGRGSARVAIKSSLLELQASVPLPENPVGRFANIHVTIIEEEGKVRLDKLRIGRLPIPVFVADRVILRLQENENTHFAMHAVKDVRIRDGVISVAYEMPGDVKEKVSNLLVSRDTQERIRAYHERLAEVSQDLHSTTISLMKLLVPLFTLAHERSGNGNPMDENKAALFVLTLYVNGKDVSRILPAASAWPQLAWRSVILSGRDDFAKHFLVSAAVTAGAGGSLSDALGVYKEVQDAHGGSGFSFTDIAADRAGTRFGLFAVESETSARTLQERVVKGLSERLLMPKTSDLPEFMAKDVFARRFEKVGSPKYNKMMEEIERRIAALEFYQ